MSQVMTAFQERLNKAPPRRETLLDWEKWAFALGSVKRQAAEWKKENALGNVCSGCRFH
jgi:hypothetical protein